MDVHVQRVTCTCTCVYYEGGKLEYDNLVKQEDEARALYRLTRSDMIKTGPEWAKNTALMALKSAQIKAEQRTQDMFFAYGHGDTAKSVRKFAEVWELTEVLRLAAAEHTSALRLQCMN